MHTSTRERDILKMEESLWEKFLGPSTDVFVTDSYPLDLELIGGLHAIQRLAPNDGSIRD